MRTLRVSSPLDVSYVKMPHSPKKAQPTGKTAFSIFGLQSSSGPDDSQSTSLFIPQGQPLHHRVSSSTLGRHSSPLSPDVSSSDMSEDGQDPGLVRLISVASRLLLIVYLGRGTQNSSPRSSKNASGPSESLQGDNGSQQSSRNPSSNGKRRKNELDEDANQGGDVRRSKRRQRDIKSPTDRPLACPFNKYDNILFGPDSPDASYRSCAAWSCVTPAHLKYDPICISNLSRTDIC